MISGRAGAKPKSGDGPVEQIRVFKVAKDSAVKAKRQAINQLHALLVNADPAFRETVGPLGRKALVTRCAALQPADDGSVVAAVQHAMRSLARRVQSLDAEIAELTERLQTLVLDAAPNLLLEHGVGVDSAATLLRTVGDNPQRLRSEAGFAAL